MTNNWLTFWKGENAFDEAMGVNYAYFLKKVEEYVKPAPNDVVLDIGSGPGNLEDAWHNKVKEIHGLDISERYNNMVRQKHSDHPNIYIHDLPEDDYVNLTAVKGNTFSIVIVMSVLQYYRSKEEVIALIKNIKQIVAPGATVLLCDLMVREAFLVEILQVLKKAFKEGKLLSVLSLFYHLRFSNYYKVKKQSGFLVLPVEEWQHIISSLQLNAVFLKEPITLQKDRKNLLIKF